MESATPIVTFQYDNRDRLIHETRVVNGSTTVYDIAYTYDGLGNRLEKRDEAASPRTKTTYFYDSDPANRDPNYPTNNNRLMRYEESVDNGQGGWTLTRTVKYVYYITGHASNIIIKDATDPWHRGLALYYTSAGKLWRAVWEQWQVNEQQQVTDYTRTGGRESYYDGARQRYLSRLVDATNDNPGEWKPTEEPQLWTDYLGDDPAGDFAVVEKWDGVNEKWYIESQTEKLGYLGGYGTHAQQDAQTGATRYLHGDLIRSTMLTTDEGGLADETLAYTAFGEPVGPGGVGVPPASDTRYRYAGGWGYEDDLLKLDGAPGTKPIVLLHVGWRWYDPALGRFVQRDPIGVRGGLNVYVYASGSPLVRVDPRGLDVVVISGGGDIVVGPYGGFWIGVEVGVCIGPDGIAGFVSGGTGWGIGMGASAGLTVCATNAPNTQALGGPGWSAGGFGPAGGAVVIGGPGYGGVGGSAGGGAGGGGWAGPTGTAVTDPAGWGGLGKFLQGGYFCVARGTLVAVGDESMRVEDLEPGCSIDVIGGGAGLRSTGQLLAVRTGMAHEVIEIHLPLEVLACTASHPFWVEGRGWTPAAKLRAGDELISITGECVPVQAVDSVSLAEPVEVFDITTEPSHTFFVGRSRVLVHNKVIY